MRYDKQDIEVAANMHANLSKLYGEVVTGAAIRQTKNPIRMYNCLVPSWSAWHNVINEVFILADEALHE